MEFARLNPQQFTRFREFIYRQSGIRIDDKKVALLSNRIRRRLKAGEFSDFDSYYDYLTSAGGGSELESFLDAITTNETFFFRTEKNFDWFTDEFITDAIQQHRIGRHPARLKIWSAGCASGAEPYSLAICLAENAHRLVGWQLEIVGTDISEEALGLARQGVYKRRSIEIVSESLRQKYFDHDSEEDTWRIREEIRELVRFKRHNLMTRFDEVDFDCVFIRNVLIYFDQQSKSL